MSHITKISTAMSDIDCIKEALTEHGYSFTENSVATAYGSARINGDLVVKNKGAYDIAFVKQGDGSYDIQSDWYGHGAITREKFIQQIKHTYAVVKAVNEVKKHPQLHVLKKEKLANGTSRIRVSVLS